MSILLLRHGETEWNLEGRFQGRLNSPLTAKGKAQAKANADKIRKYIKDIGSIKIFSSPLGRAKSTAYIVCDELGIERERIIFENRIAEFSYGVFEGKLKKDLNKTEAFKAREADKWFYQIENGESYKLVYERVKPFFNSISSESEVIIIAHEMVNRVLRGIYLNLPKEEILKLRQPNEIVSFLNEKREFLF